METIFTCSYVALCLFTYFIFQDLNGGVSCSVAVIILFPFFHDDFEKKDSSYQETSAITMISVPSVMTKSFWGMITTEPSVSTTPIGTANSNQPAKSSNRKPANWGHWFKNANGLRACHPSAWAMVVEGLWTRADGQPLWSGNRHQ